MSFQPISLFPPQPFGNCEEELPKKTCRPTVGQLLALSANCGLFVDCHAVSLSPRIQIHHSKFKQFLMNIINYKPKMELLFILHDFMLPPSFLIQPHLPQLSFSKSWAGMD